MSIFTPSHPHLPPELISLIFDTVGYARDWATLKDCSLVSHTYLPQVRRHLFAVISLHLRSHPNPIVIRDVVRRMKGLCDFFQRDPDANRYVKTLKVLDSYPVYDSEWITQQTWLPVLLDHLHHVRYFTFGCEVGYLQWILFSPQLQHSLASQLTSPQLLTLTLCNLGSVPPAVLKTSARHMYLNNIISSNISEGALMTDPHWPVDLSSLPSHSRLVYLQLRTVSMANTNSAWDVMETHAEKLKLIKWRCWEDAQAIDGVSFPGQLDIGKLTALRKLSVRMSYGKTGRDLTGFCDLLDATTRPSHLRSLDLCILFPLQHHPHDMPELGSHSFWRRLAEVLMKPEYRTLQRVNMELTVHERVGVRNGRRINSVVVFRGQMKLAARRLLNIPSLHLRLKVKGFHLDAHGE